MYRLKLARLGLLISVGGVLALTGCGIGTVVISQDAPTATASSTMQAIRGSDYGGHAPLVGAHIYLVQPGTAGYGSVVSSILTTDSGNTYYTGGHPAPTGEKFPLTANGSWTNSGFASDQFVPAGYKGVTTDSEGIFYITGDYTCVVGKPVILIGYGGSPSYVGQGTGTTTSTQTNTFTVSNATTFNNGSTGVYLTYTTTSQQLFYVGETVSVTGATGPAVGFNQSGTVLASAPTSSGTQTLDTLHFSIFVPYNATLTSTTGSGLNSGAIGQTATALPPFNPAATNMAVLGNCPSSGNFSTPGNGSLNFIYMNEVSTAAAAYALNQFANWSATDQTGNDEFHIGTPNTTQAVQAIANAALTAGLLYDIQGGNVSTTFAGEGHIARTVTPNGGNGTVPQPALDTLGNILAACVDSPNTYRAGTGVQSAACLTLEKYATDNGAYDTTGASTHIAFNIAQAAMNIAHWPQGNGTTSGSSVITPGTSTTAANFVSALYGLPTGNVPFTPNLTSTGLGQPNDFAIAIQWSGANANGGTAPNSNQDVQIDSVGNAWWPAPGSTTAQLFQFAPNGAVTGYTGALSGEAQESIDTSDRVWVPGVAGNYRFTAGTTAGTLVGTALTSANGGGIAVDASANQWFINNSRTTTATIGAQSATGVQLGGFPISQPTSCTNNARYVTLDSAGYVWTTDSNAFFNNVTYLCRYTGTGQGQYTYLFPANGLLGGSNFSIPRYLVTDAGDNLLVAEKNYSTLTKVAQGSLTANSGVTVVSLPTLNPIGISVDGLNTLWVSHQTSVIAQYTDNLVRITPNYLVGAGLTPNGMGALATDPSGNVWTTGGAILYEYVGMATPTITPLSLAKFGTASNRTGTKP